MNNDNPHPGPRRGPTPTRPILRILASFSFLLLLASRAGAEQDARRPAPPLWEIGQRDDSSAEFGDYRATAVEQVVIGTDGHPRTATKSISRGLRASSNPAMEIAYDLPAVPEHGALFSFKLLNAPKSGAQMAVFSNGLMAGLIQLWGTAGTNSQYRWMKTYRLYIPREMLSAGPNVLRLEAARPIYSDPSDTTIDRELWWEWDDLELEALSRRALEPVHGSVCYLGTTLKNSANDFLVNDDTVRLAPIALPWLGVAYSGNTIRCDFWYDVARSQSRRLEYLKTLRDLNLTTAVDNVSGSHFHNDPDGSMPARVKADLDKFLADYGSLFQYYELGNEPCMFGGGYAETMQLARYLNCVKPEHVTVSACGWAYGGGKGTPRNWDASALFRRNVEALCGATNGHSYGYSYADNRGGSFVENLATYSGVEDGWPIDSIATETGTNNWHSEGNGTRFKSDQPHAAAFDRILRAHLAVVQRTMQHAAIFDDFGMFQPPTNWSDPTTLRAYPGVNKEDTRLKTYRRLALAYATHGAPLAYVYLNRPEVADQKVYFRAVDTASLPALPGSGGTSNKVLLNFVNFDSKPHKMSVRVFVPWDTMVSGERFGSADVYADAHSDVDLKIDPGHSLVLSESLRSGESVQYILSQKGERLLYPPRGIRAEPGDGRVSLSWSAVSGAATYEIRRSLDGGEFRKIGRTPAVHWTDTELKNGSTAGYVVRARGADAGDGQDSAPVEARVGAPSATRQLTAAASDRKVVLSWPAADRATAYTLSRAARLAGPFQVISNLAPATDYVDAEVINGSQYFYTVRASNTVGSGEASAPVRAVPHAPPAAPIDVSALAASGRVVLNWHATTEGAAYTVARGASSEGPFAPIAANLMTDHYNDDQVKNGAAYFYTVSAIDLEAPAAGGVSIASAPVTATPASGELPAPWKHADIGHVGKPGSATVTPHGVFTILGAGNDIWGEADTEHFAFQPLTGDFTLTAHVAAFDDTHDWSKVGLMLRASLDAAAPMTALAVTPGKGVSFTRRDHQAGPCIQSGGPSQPWLRLTRKADTVTAYTSTDGKEWQKIGSADIASVTEVYAGLAVCSHDEGRLNKAVFDQVTLEKNM